MEASFLAIGLFPSHQLGIIPIDFLGPSIGLFYRQIGQKYDLHEPPIILVPRVRRIDRSDPPAEDGGTHFSPREFVKSHSTPD